MTRGRPILLFVAFLSFAYCARAGAFEAKWESLDRRPVPQWWQAEITVPSVGAVRNVRPLGFSAKVAWRQENGGLVLSVPPAVPTELPGSAAWTLRIETEDGAM